MKNNLIKKLKNNKHIKNIRHFIENLILNFFIKKDFVAKYKGKFFSLKTGKNYKKNEIKNNLLINFDVRISSYIKKNNMIGKYPFVYYSEDEDLYYMTKNLDYLFIKEVLKLHYKYPAFLIEDKNFLYSIGLLGNEFKIIKKDEMYEEMIELFFQGLKYKKVSYIDILILITYSLKEFVLKFMIFFPIIILLFILTIIINNILEKNNISFVSLITNNIEDTKTLTDTKQMFKSLLTNKDYLNLNKISNIKIKINKLFNTDDLNLKFIYLNRVSFDRNTINMNLYSLILYNNYKLLNDLYFRNIKYEILNDKKNILKNYINLIKEYNKKKNLKCKKFLMNNGIITAKEENAYVILLNKKLNLNDELYLLKFLKNNCIGNITGTISLYSTDKEIEKGEIIYKNNLRIRILNYKEFEKIKKTYNIEKLKKEIK